jgi:hypothetical protein
MTLAGIVMPSDAGRFEDKREFENDRRLDWQLGRIGHVKDFIDVVGRFLRDEF